MSDNIHGKPPILACLSIYINTQISEIQASIGNNSVVYYYPMRNSNVYNSKNPLFERRKEGNILI